MRCEKGSYEGLYKGGVIYRGVFGRSIGTTQGRDGQWTVDSGQWTVEGGWRIV